MTRHGLIAFASAAIVAATVTAFLRRDVPPEARRARYELEWPDGGAPATGHCRVAVGRFEPACLLSLQDDEEDESESNSESTGVGLDEPSVSVGWRAQYVWIRAQWGGELPRRVPARRCFTPLSMRPCAYDSTKPRTVVRVAWARTPDAGEDFDCACSTGSDCLSRDRRYRLPDGGRGPVPKDGITLQDWRGEGCQPKPCVEVNQTVDEITSGGSSLPEACK